MGGGDEDPVGRVTGGGGGTKSIGKMRRQYVKGQFAKMAGGGDLVSDAEKLAMEKQSQQAVAQGLGAQQRGLERAAMAQTGGSPLVAGAFQEASKGLGEAGADAAVQATGEDKRLQAALRDKRGAEALAAGERLHKEQKEQAARTAEFGLRAAEVGFEVAGLIGGGV